MRPIKFLSVLLIFFTLNFSAPAQDYQVRIATLGNSITIGATLTNPTVECYPAQLQVMLQEKYGDTCKVSNFAVSGRTLLKHGDFPLWNEPSFKQALDFLPNICLILLGTNDSKPQNWDVYGDEYIDDYLSMIDTFKYRNPFTKYIVCFPPPAYDIVWGIRDSVIVNHVIPAIDSIVELTGATLVDFYTPLIDSVSLFPDKIHPNARGSKVMAKIVFDKIVESDIIHKVETGLTFVSSFKSDRYYITVDDTATIEWWTLCADSVWINNNSASVEGNLKISPDESTKYKLYAWGKKKNDSTEVSINVYDPVFDSILIDPFSKTVDPGDSVYITLKYLDRFAYLLKGVSYTINWSIVDGSGDIIPKSDNSAVYVGNKKGMNIIEAEAEGIKANSYIKVRYDASGFRKVDSENNPKIFPNPTQSNVNIQFEAIEGSYIDVKIFAVTGTVIEQSRYIAAFNGTNQISIGTEKFAEGIYFYEISLENRKYSGKISVKPDSK
jgi:lysophospholipase L1-like esterase